jgi:hypothetical protein
LYALRRILVGTVVLAWVTRAGAQSVDSAQTVWVTVRDGTSKQPIVGARVRPLHDSTRRALTDDTGLASIDLRFALRTLVTTRLGFRPDTSHVSDVSWAAGLVEVSLVPNAQELAAVSVRATNSRVNPTIAEFESRRARRGGGGATFIGREVLERHTSSKLTDVLRRGVQGVKFIDSAGVQLPVSARGEVIRVYQNQTNRTTGSARSGMERVLCVLRVAVDGVPKEWGYDLNVIEPREVYGVEIYAGPATLPAQYQSMGRDGYCGLILVWTRPH